MDKGKTTFQWDLLNVNFSLGAIGHSQEHKGHICGGQVKVFKTIFLILGYVFIPPKTDKTSIVELSEFMEHVDALLVYPYEEDDKYLLQFGKSIVKRPTLKSDLKYFFFNVL